MNLVSKYGYIDKLDDTVNKYNYIYYSTIKMKPLTYLKEDLNSEEICNAF